MQAMLSRVFASSRIGASLVRDDGGASRASDRASYPVRELIFTMADLIYNLMRNITVR
jgi:hypothetical protein